MRTTIVIDEDLIEELMRLEKSSSRSEAIRAAVEEYVRRRRMDEFMSLAGSGLIDLDWRQVEQEEMKEIKRHARRR